MFGTRDLITQFEARLADKDQHISDLREEVSSLRKLVFYENPTKDIPLVQVEGDAILNGRDEQIIIDDSPEAKEHEETTRERDRLLAGTY